MPTRKTWKPDRPACVLQGEPRESGVLSLAMPASAMDDPSEAAVLPAGTAPSVGATSVPTLCRQSLSGPKSLPHLLPGANGVCSFPTRPPSGWPSPSRCRCPSSRRFRRPSGPSIAGGRGRRAALGREFGPRASPAGKRRGPVWLHRAGPHPAKGLRVPSGPSRATRAQRVEAVAVPATAPVNARSPTTSHRPPTLPAPRPATCDGSTAARLPAPAYPVRPARPHRHPHPQPERFRCSIPTPIPPHPPPNPT